MRRRLRFVAAGASLALAAGAITAAAAVALHAGPQGDGTAITPNGWVVTPAGKQVDLIDGSPAWADRPFSEVLSPDGRWLLVGSDGQSTQSLKVVDTISAHVTQTIPYAGDEALFVGLSFSPDGRHAYASAGGNNKVRVYDVTDGALAEKSSIKVPGYPAGLTVSADGATLYVAENQGDALAVIDLKTSTVTSVSIGTCKEGSDPVQFAPAGYTGFVPQCQPYGVALSADGKTAYVSDWGAHTVSMVSTTAKTFLGKIAVGTHPIAVATNPVASLHQIYVANGDSDSISVIDTATNKVVRTIDLAPYEGAPVGSNPDALTVSPDGRSLYVSNGGNNDVVVIDLASGEDAIQGMIPTAWYPSGVALSHDAKTLYVINAKGLGAGPNKGYLQGKYGPSTQYVGSMMHGTLSIIESPARDKLEKWTEQVVHNNGFNERDKVRSTAGDGQHSGSVVPRRAGDPSPIKHVIYVIKENRTFDQVFGSLGKGNGDSSVNLFGDESAPNIRNLARQFVTLDNFYASAEVSADGWNWSTAANADGYVQRTWPANYSDGNRGRGYDFEGGNYATAPNSNPRDAYLWDRLHDASVSYRNYGFFTLFPGTSTPQPTAKNLIGQTSPTFPGYNLAFPDSPCAVMTAKMKPRTSRFTEWENEFKGYVASNNLPSFEFLRLPNDHTHGTSAGWPTPKQYVADNDYAVGKLVDTVSHSKYWASTAIFVLEDDAQDGADHVDAHRTEALVISPYTQIGKVDSTLYSTVSMLRTMELIVGLGPLTQFDAAATPMLNSFSSKANTNAYSATVPTELAPCTAAGSLNTASNTPESPLAAESAAMNFDTADAPDNSVLNQAIWQSIKGAGSPMPQPKNATMPAPSGTMRDTDG
jgi:YVTN family beta-propeller protein